MTHNAINSFDQLDDACIRYASVMSDILGITYGTLCIVLFYTVSFDYVARIDTILYPSLFKNILSCPLF